MSTKISIANVALSRLGAHTINDTSEQTVEANLILALWDNARTFLLRQNPWNFAIKREQLGQLAQEPLNRYLYQYQLPSDHIRTLTVTSGEDGNVTNFDYKVEGRNILTNAEYVYLKYVYDNDVVATWEFGFQELMAARLQMEMAYPITKAASVQERAEVLYADTLRKTKNIDAGEDFDDPLGLNESAFVGVRFGGGM